ncbi:nucleotidyltransferase domain-containing protein [Candidatus Woesearchaeota archaeon]|nr:nucleotidyltransferase domain-containing protein [Candidatus Woesearchaeota archaeon]
MNRNDDIIVQYLLEKKNEEINILQLSKELRTDYKTVYSIIKRLEKQKILKLEPFGQSNRIKLAQKATPAVFGAEYARRKELLKDKNIAVMLHDLKTALSSSCYALLLFGSHAKKTQTRHSDIDIMFIVPDGKEAAFEKETSRAIRSLPLPIHCLVFSEAQFLEMIHAKESNVGKEALKHNIILYGIETYYEMIQ